MTQSFPLHPLPGSAGTGTGTGTGTILAVANGDPADRDTFSGVAASLIDHLARHSTVRTMDVRPGRTAELAAAVETVRADRSAWRARYRVARSFATAMRRRAARLAADGSPPDATLQFGSWFDLTGIERLGPGPRCTYIDTNFASFLRRPDIDVGSDSSLARWRLGFERRLYDDLDLILTFSDWARRSMIDDFGQDEAKVVTIGAGSNVPASFHEIVPRSPARFLFVGKKFERKGGPELLAAFDRVRRRHPEAELWIVGPEQQTWPTRPGVIHWGRLDPRSPGQLDMLRSLYEHATCFVMPSRFEPFGLVFVEAMLHGLPCIGTDVCAIPELITDGETGTIVPLGDIEALAEAMVAMASAPEQAAAMGRRARNLADQRFRWDLVADRVVHQISRVAVT